MHIRILMALMLLVLGHLVPRSASAQANLPPEHDHTGEQGDAGHDMPESPDSMAMFPMARYGSGTTWLPDSSPVVGLHRQIGGWRLMGHGMLYAGLNVQGTRRGATELISTNWLMLMASRTLGSGEITLRGMWSLEPLSVGADGYPLLLQSGETYQGELLVDRQHPHDLFMELAAHYTRRLTNHVGFELYGGLAGEPALGPVAFPHRISAMPDPLAPLGHHWLDSTHITFGVVTAGIFTRRAKIEASWFNGREPDEERYDLDLRPFDSYAARLSVNPARNWSIQASYGFLASPEALESEQSIHRTTASVIYNRPLRHRGNWATTAIWGRNTPSPSDDAPATDALFLESALDTGAGLTLFVRAEQIAKTGHDLDLPPPLEHEVFIIHNTVLGVTHTLDNLGPLASLRPGIGARVGINHLMDEELGLLYGTRWPVGFMVYLTLQPARMAMMDHHHH